MLKRMTKRQRLILGAIVLLLVIISFEFFPLEEYGNLTFNFIRGMVAAYGFYAFLSGLHPTGKLKE